jgi:hypothetical protein
VAAIQTLRTIVSVLRSNNRDSNNGGERGRSRNMVGEFALCCLEFLLNILEDVIKYINNYAFCYVAAYGFSFIDSGKKVYDLFLRRGWTAIINDNLISNTLNVGIIFMSAAVACVGMFFFLMISSQFVDTNGTIYLIGIGSFFIG